MGLRSGDMAVTRLQMLATSVASQGPKKLLHHYTSFPSFLAMMESRCFWATELRYLNDRQEVSYFSDRLAGAIEAFSPPAGSDMEVAKAHVVEWIERRAQYDNTLVCAFSLSEEPDLLSQWRSYTSPGQGLSLGMGPGILEKLAKDQNWIIGKCSYSPDAARNASRLTRDLIFEHIAETVPWQPTNVAPKYVYERALVEIEPYVMQVGAFFKHPAFEEEKEWRLVSPVSSGHENPADIFHRTGTSTIIPFRKFKLQTGDMENDRRGPFAQVIVGPTTDYERTRRSVSRVLTNAGLHGLSGADIAPSRIPLRNT